MAHHEHGEPGLMAQPLSPRFHDAGTLFIQSACGLIQKKDIGFQKQTPNKTETLKLPYGEGLGMIFERDILEEEFLHEPA